MASEALLQGCELLNPYRIARCMLCYLAAHHDVVEPLLDLFTCLGVRGRQSSTAGRAGHACILSDSR